MRPNQDYETTQQVEFLKKNNEKEFEQNNE